MPSIQIKNVPEDVHAVLRRRAGESGQSLQEYLLALLSLEASTPTVADVLERAGHRSGGRAGFAAAAAAVRAERDSR
jgi:plasmid stability protein